MNNNVEKLMEALKKARDTHPELRDNDTELARKAEMNQSTVHRILSGKNPDPRISSVLKIANACGVQLWKFHIKPERQKYHNWLDSLSEEGFREFEKVVDVMKVFKRSNEEEIASSPKAPLEDKPERPA